MNKITLKDIKKLNPCRSGYENLVKYYPDFNMTMVEFLQLEHIPHNNKEWLIRKMVNVNILKWWSLECAKSVAHIYNKKYPNDNRVNECLKANKDFLLGLISLDELLIKRRAATAASSTSYDVDAAFAAAAAASDDDGASYASDASAYAAYSYATAAYTAYAYASYATASYAANAYAYDDDDSAYAKKEQWDINFMLLIRILKEEVE